MREQSAAPPIAVVIPLYNKARHVERALRSVFAQTSPADEIIVVDDASTDDGLSRVRQFDDTRLTVLQRRHPGPGGYAARNLAVSAARAPWIAFLDADDEWRREHLAFVRGALACAPAHIGGIFAAYDDAYGPERRAHPIAPALVGRHHEPIDFERFLKAWLQTRDCPVWTSASVFSRTALLGAGLFPAGRTARGGDKDLWLRLASRNELIFSPARTAIFHRIADNKVTRTVSTARMPYICTTIDALLASGKRPRECALLRSLANQEVLLYARQAFAREPIPPSLRHALHMPEGWRSWLMLAALEAAPAPLARAVRAARALGPLRRAHPQAL